MAKVVTFPSPEKLYAKFAKIPRDVAEKLNPIIGGSQGETLESVAGLVRDLGYFVEATAKEQLPTERLYLFTNALAAALDYEHAQAHNARMEREASHG